MGIETRTSIVEYPGAVTRVFEPFSCTLHPTIQELAAQLMGVESEPSVIIAGALVTEKTRAALELDCEI